MRISTRTRVVSVGLLLLFAWWLHRRLADPPPGEQGEVVPPDEDEYTAGIINSAVDLIEGAQKPGDIRHRDVHAKAHGCVKARVEVGEVAAAFRHGVFAEPRSYDAWIRFSSGDTHQQADKVRDARGFAMKLMGVPGEKLLEDERNEETQDFIMINSRVFFIPTAKEYGVFMRTMGDGSRYGYFFAGPSPGRWRLREMLLALKTLKGAPRSPLDPQYHSLSAYKLGPDLSVKYSAKPCALPGGKGGTKSGDNFLRDALKSDLAAGNGCFDLLVQPQVAGKNMPVEDTTIEWREKDSPFVKVARVVIPKQAFDTPAQNAFCEDLSFTPWHALPEHRPLGGMNRLRKAVYREISRYRHDKNRLVFSSSRREPKGFCLDLTGQPCPDAAP
jgi:catalase